MKYRKKMADEMCKQGYKRCNHLGHLWDEAGGALELCLVCEAERWAKRPDRLTGADYLRARAASRRR